MEKIIRRGVAALLIVASLMTTAIVGAAVQVFDGTGQYIVSTFENPDIARQRASDRAIRDVQKQAGVYLKTFCRANNIELTDEEISAVTNNITKIVGDVYYDTKAIPVSDNETAMCITATLKTTIDTDGIYDFIKRNDKEKKEILQRNNNLQEDIAKNDKLVEILKEQYKYATSQDEKNILRKQMKVADLKFLIEQKAQDIAKLDYASKITTSIKIDILELLTLINEERGTWSVADCDKALELDPNDYEVYTIRGKCYVELGQYEKCIRDCDKAIQLYLYEWAAYYNRALAYGSLGKYEQAIQDFSKVIEEFPNDSSYARAYYNRGVCYQELGDETKAQADFAKAKELGYNG